MSKRLAANKKFVNSLCKCSPEELKKKLKCANKDQIKTLVDLTLNIMKKNIAISPKKVKIIKQNRKFLRHIVHPSFSIKSKKRFMIQKGGGFWTTLFGGFGRSAAAGAVGRSAAVSILGTTASMGSLGSRALLSSGTSAVARAGVGAVTRAAGSAAVRGGSS